MVIRWNTIVRHSHILSINTPPIKSKCITLYKPVVNGNITFWERRRSYTLIISLCSSYRHRGNCRTTTIRSGPPTCNNFMSTSSIRHVSQIVSMTALVDLLWLHSPFHKCTFMKVGFYICVFMGVGFCIWVLLYKRIYGNQLSYMHIYGELPYTCIYKSWKQYMCTKGAIYEIQLQ